MIDTLILAGGLGTRLAQTVPHLPKALAPIEKVPFLEILLRQLERSHLPRKIVLALGHKASSITSYLEQRKSSLPIEISLEHEPLGTGGAILHALEKLSTETLLVLNGDSFFDLSLPSFYEFHQIKNGDLSIACREVEDASRYGKVEIDTASRITAFSEKSPLAQKGWINGGIYLAKRSLFSSWPKGPYSLEREMFPALLKMNLFAYPHAGAFIDIGTDSSYWEAQKILKPWIAS